MCWCSSRGAARARAAPRSSGGCAATAPRPTRTTSPRPRPAARAPRVPCARARATPGSEPGDVDYVNAHGTSTPLNDRSETAALKAALGDARRSVPVSSTKSAIGHLLGAAGAVEAVATVLALRERVAPADARLGGARGGLDLDYVPGEARRWVERPPPGRDLELVRLRRPQRGAVLRGRGMSAHARAASTRSARLAPRASAWSGSATPARCASSAPTVALARRRTRRPGDGVVAAAGTLRRPAGLRLRAGPPPSSAARSAPRTAESIVRVLRMAGDAGAPVVGFVESAGARMDEGVAALDGYGRIFSRARPRCPASVPADRRRSPACRPGGGSYSPALDRLRGDDRGREHVPDRARRREEVIGEDVAKHELGGPRVHSRNGVCHLMPATTRTRWRSSRDLLATCRSRRPAGRARARRRARSAVTDWRVRPDERAQGLRRARR